MESKKTIRPIIERDAEYIRELLDTSTSASEMSEANDSTDENEEDIIEVDFVVDEDNEFQEVKFPGRQRMSSGSVLYGKDSQTKWDITSKPRRENLCLTPLVPSAEGNGKNAESAIDCWRTFFTDRILYIIVCSTNKEIESKRGEFARERDCELTDILEIKAFFGLLYLMGYFRGSKLNTEDLWNSDGTGIELFGVTMSRNRFHFLMRNLRFDDRGTLMVRKSVDKLASIREVFELFTEECRRNFSVSQFVSVGEILVRFNGKCGFRQYIPSKPGKSGIKIFALVDTKTFYTLNLEVYVGKQPEGPFLQDCSSYGVVKRLCRPIFGSGRNVTGDTWFSSFKLAKDLLNERVTYVGALTKSNREIPACFVDIKNREPDTSKFAFHDGCMTLVSYVPKRGKNILLLSTMHNTANLEMLPGERKKPVIFSFYNETKNGVDGVNKLCSNYSVSKNTNRWPMAVFYCLLNIGAINAHVLYKKNKGPIKRRVFIKTLSLELVSGLLKRRSELKALPRELRPKKEKFLTNMTKRIEGCESMKRRIGESEASSGTPRKKRCFLCETKNIITKHVCSTCGNYICSQHVKYVCKSCTESRNYDRAED